MGDPLRLLGRRPSRARGPRGRLRRTARLLAMLAATPPVALLLAAHTADPPEASSVPLPRAVLTVPTRPTTTDIRPMLSAADAASSRGDTSRAWDLLHAAHATDPSNAEARVQLRALDRQPGFQLPVDDASLASLRGLLGPQFREVRTEHFLLLSNAPNDWTIRRGQLLERARHQFFRSLDRLGIPPVPHRHRLFAILFSSQEEYASFARRTHGPSSTWVAAYYDGSLNAIVMFDDHDAPWNQTTTNERSSDARSSRASRPTPLARSVASAADTTTLHEAAHLLAFNCGVQVRGVDYPLWVSEGLATTFETDRPDLPFGPGRSASPRRGAIDANELDALAPLVEVIPARAAPEDPHKAAAFYARSWALFDTLAARRPRDLAAYLESLRNAPRGPIAPDAQRALFEARFGPVEDVAKEIDRRLQKD
ncbi:MAG: DUF1570 domain-containing protein [Phycisphaerales bacterium]|nr:DUF1570 domain-containing protein [Phycisphaerales bacterium]